MAMQTNSSTLTVKGVPQDVIEALDDMADAHESNRSEQVRQILSRAVEGGSDDVYEPTDNTLRDIYQAAWEASNSDLVVSLRKHGSVIAQKSRINKTAVKMHLHDLHERDYAQKLGSYPVGKGDSTAYRIKPPCANPTKWRYGSNR